jgi:uncharacterized protein
MVEPRVTLIKSRRRTEYYQSGQLHRTGGPSVVETVADRTALVEYHCRGKLHRVGAPAVYRYWDLGRTYYYYFEGKLHRENGPAIIAYYQSGAVESVRFYYNGVKHRKDGPSIEKYYPSGQLACVEYHTWGRRTASAHWPPTACTWFEKYDGPRRWLGLPRC